VGESGKAEERGAIGKKDGLGVCRKGWTDSCFHVQTRVRVRGPDVHVRKAAERRPGGRDSTRRHASRRRACRYTPWERVAVGVAAAVAAVAAAASRGGTRGGRPRGGGVRQAK
jgi:anti-sigma-K factor RskA